MPEIQLSTFIKAPRERIFDLSRSIDLHIISTKHTREQAVAGVMEGLIGLNETVTWQAFHLFKKRRFSSILSAMTRPEYFRDEMTEGDFVYFKHDHYFTESGTGTLMQDIIEFKSPYRIIGKVFNKIYLTRYLKDLVIKRNSGIKLYAESGKWRSILKEKINN